MLIFIGYNEGSQKVYLSKTQWHDRERVIELPEEDYEKYCEAEYRQNRMQAALDAVWRDRSLTGVIKSYTLDKEILNERDKS